MFSRKLVLLGILVTATIGVSLMGCGNSNSVVTPTPAPPVDEQPLPPVNGFSVGSAGSNVELDWAASSSAVVTGYNVYRYWPAPDRENAYVKLNDTPVSTNHFSDAQLNTGGVFKVRAVDATGRESASPGYILVNPLPSGGNPPGGDVPPVSGDR